MVTFREFISSQGLNQQQTVPMVKDKKWKATKEQIIAYWHSLRPDKPIQMRPIDYAHKGSTYGEDGIRLTGSPEFISTVLARLKELLNYETPSTKLSLTYRETESPSKVAMGQSKTSYVFYIASRQRGGNSSEKP